MAKPTFGKDDQIPMAIVYDQDFMSLLIAHCVSKNSLDAGLG